MRVERKEKHTPGNGEREGGRERERQRGRERAIFLMVSALRGVSTIIAPRGMLRRDLGLVTSA
jgi:hypothetical protein